MWKRHMGQYLVFPTGYCEPLSVRWCANSIIMFPYIYKHNGFLQDYYLFKDQDIELDEFSRQIDAN